MILDNIAMWVIRRKTVDWDCSKTLTVLETLKILNQLREEFCVSSEVEQTFLRFGRVRIKLRSLTVQPNLKLFPWTLVFAWTVSSLVISGIWTSKYCILQRTLQNGKPVTKHGNRDTIELFNVDHVITNAKPSHFEAMLFHFWRQ